MQADNHTTNLAGCGGIPMLRVSLFFALGCLMLVPASAAQADWHSFWERVRIDKHRNNCWPMPFQKVDRQAVCRTLSIQLANGWRRQNTLSEFYFDRDTQTLNVSGRRKLYAILSETPEQHRTIYVVQTMNPEVRERRIRSIEKVATEMFGGAPPEVVPVSVEPRSWPADYIDNINRRVESSLPSPRLPQFQNTTGS